MGNNYIKNIVRFIVLVLLQVLVLNHMNLGGYINPYVYILFILLLPVFVNKSGLLILAFFTGLTIDFFGNTPGLHAAATVMMAFARPGVLRVFFENLDFSAGEEPNLSKLKPGGFLKYILVMVFIHHSVLFFLEVFSFQGFLSTILRIALSTLVTTLLMMTLVLLFSSRKK
jgi:rod shape-determining protein MreD